MHAHIWFQQKQHHPKCHPSTVRVPIRSDRIRLVMDFLLQEYVRNRYEYQIDTDRDEIVATFADPNTAFDFRLRFA